MADVKIVMTGHGRGEVFVDGRKLDGVQSMNFSAGIGQKANTLTVTLAAKSVRVEGLADVAVSAAPSLADRFHDEYKRWLMLPWWKRWFGRSPLDRLPHGSNPPASGPKPPPPPNPPAKKG